MPRTMSCVGTASGWPLAGERMLLRAEHQHRSLDLRLRRERNVHGHLVAVEIGVERGANQRMDADGLAFDQHGLEGLNAQPVQRGSAIEQHGMLADHFLENVPNHGFLLLPPFPWPA